MTEENGGRIRYSANLELPAGLSTGAQGIILLGNASDSGPCRALGIGVLGQDGPACLLEKGSIILDLYYIQLNDTTTGHCYGVRLQPGTQAATGRGRHNILLKWVNETGEAGACDTTYQVVSVDMQ